MRFAERLIALAAALTIAGCATPPPAPPDEYEEPVLPAPATALPPAPSMIEYPPIEPVEPVEAPPAPVVAQPAPAPALPPAVPAPASPAPPTAAETAPAPAPAASAPAELSAEELQMNALLADLQRYGTMPGDDARREVNAMTQLLARQRTDANRVRLAMLYTMTRNGPQDDLRALQLLENVAKSGPGSPPVKQLALVLQIQISERVRAVRDEQQKAETAIQKLEALRAMERSLLRDRVRGGGGGGGGGSSGGGGGGGGAGGGAGG